MGKNIVILTGAGISAESGIRTFRDGNGLWENHRVEDVATPEAFARDPRLVHEFYNLRRAQLKEPAVKPNAAHLALAKLEENWDGDFLLVTQNVDDLHQRAGSKRILTMHGQLRSAWCTSCDLKTKWLEDLGLETECPRCSVKGDLRPDIVWFNEMPYHMDEIQNALECADVFVSIGTSGQVYPAAAFVRWASGARTIEVNREETAISTAFNECRVGSAGTEVPALVKDLLAELD